MEVQKWINISNLDSRFHTDDAGFLSFCSIHSSTASSDLKLLGFSEFVKTNLKNSFHPSTASVVISFDTLTIQVTKNFYEIIVRSCCEEGE
jgi:hypothetical protein